MSVFESNSDGFSWFEPSEEKRIPAYAFLPGVEPPVINSTSTLHTSEMFDAFGPFRGSLTDFIVEESPTPALEALEPTCTELIYPVDTSIGSQTLRIVMRGGDSDSPELGILESPYFPWADRPQP